MESAHFTLHTLADGVYCAVAREDGAAMSNAGIIDLGGRAVIFDTLMTPAAAGDLRVAAREMVGDAPLLVVNSHWHIDNTLGNQCFEDCAILATERTCEIMAERTVARVAHYRANAEALTAQQHASLARETDAAKRRTLQNYMTYWAYFLPALPTLRATLPAVAFGQRLTLRGTRRSVELLSYGGGHTESDAFLYLAEERILFAGDLVVNQTHPKLMHAYPGGWLAILNQLAMLECAVIAPGHGPVGGEIAFMRNYIRDLERMVTFAVEHGIGVEQVAATAVPAQYATLDAAEFFAVNMRVMYGYVARARLAGQRDG